MKQRSASFLVISLLFFVTSVHAQFLRPSSSIKDGVNGVTGIAQPRTVRTSSDGKYIYVLGNTNSTINVFQRNLLTGALSPLQSLTNNTAGILKMLQPDGMAISPDGKNIYVTSFYESSLITFSRNATTGLLAYQSTHTDEVGGVDGLNFCLEPVVSSDGKNVYVGSMSDNAVAVFTRNASTGALTYLECHKDGVAGVDGLANVTALTVSADGHHVYACGGDDNAIALFSRNSGTGALTYLQMVQSSSYLEGGNGIMCSSDNLNIYVAVYGSNALVVYNRNPVTGFLTFLQVFQQLYKYSAADQVAMSPDGKNLFLTAQGEGTIYVFSRDLTTGMLTVVDHVKNNTYGFTGFERPKSIIITPDGKHVYTSSWVDNAVTCFEFYKDNNSVSGVVYADLNNNCIKDAGESPIAGMIIKTIPEKFYAVTDQQGNYTLKIDTDSYSLTTSANNEQLQTILNTQCPASGSYAVDFTDHSNAVTGYDFAMAVKPCSMMKVEVSSNRRRRCFRNNTYVSYANKGYGNAENVEIKVILPNYVRAISSVPAWSSRVDSLLTYNIPSVASGQTGSIMIIDSVICGDEGIRGLAQCTQAIISPKSLCETENTAWDKSSIVISGTCENNTVNFIILNHGSDMTSQSQYRIYKDNVLVYQHNFQLAAGAQVVVKVPANGETIRMEADQHPLHPGKSRPRETVEACGAILTSVSKGYMLRVPVDNLNEEVAISCLPIIDSYDPNDKLVMPEGLYAEHYVPETGELEYTLRFQNTGTAVAYTISIADSIDTDLDMSTFQPGLASHPYTVSMRGTGQTVVSFNFANINLPKKSANELASQGFVTYRIKPKATATKGTVITNKGYIYFDYNSPIITNTTSSVLNDTVSKDFTKGLDIFIVTNTYSTQEATVFKVMPNPSSGEFMIQFQEAGDYKMVLRNNLGVPVWIKDFTGNEMQVTDSSCKAGIYTMEVYKNQIKMGVQKIVIQ
ncbi:MAG: hypothetical protein K0R51_1792 [Cytophagaceae bacterium]|jgi:6-phosphogluconolactonase (cycloisomerase 2 family)|nr:hypothetical protein [Cytophagaceae bacterium]